MNFKCKSTCQSISIYSSKVQNYNITILACVCVCICVRHATRTSACIAIEMEHRWRKNNSFALMHTFSVNVYMCVLGVKSIFQIALLPSKEWNAYIYYLSFGRFFFNLSSFFVASLLFLCICLVIMSYILLYMHLFKVPHTGTHITLYERTHRVYWSILLKREINQKLTSIWHLSMDGWMDGWTNNTLNF